MVSTFGLILIYTEGVFVNAVACYVNCNPEYGLFVGICHRDGERVALWTWLFQYLSFFEYATLISKVIFFHIYSHFSNFKCNIP